MRRRSGIVEHPFGTLKCRAGYRHFLVRGLDKVRGEWSLMALCYNFNRALNILGFDRFVSYMAERMPFWFKTAVTAALRRFRIHLRRYSTQIAQKLAFIRADVIPVV